MNKQRCLSSLGAKISKFLEKISRSSVEIKEKMSLLRRFAKISRSPRFHVLNTLWMFRRICTNGGTKTIRGEVRYWDIYVVRGLKRSKVVPTTGTRIETQKNVRSWLKPTYRYLAGNAWLSNIKGNNLDPNEVPFLCLSSWGKSSNDASHPRWSGTQCHTSTD